jgi:hypothetical protein
MRGERTVGGDGATLTDIYILRTCTERTVIQSVRITLIC